MVPAAARADGGTHSSADVTCVIPTHRRPELLAQALSSVLSQRVPPRRVVVVDDDPDRSAEPVARTVAAGHPVPLQYLCSGGMGPSAARNAGARAADSAWLAFLDDDDEWLPDFLALTTDTAERARVELVVTWAWAWTGRTQRAGFTMPEGRSWRDAVVVNPGMTGSNLLVSTAAFARVGGFDETLFCSNDKDLLTRLLQAGCDYRVVPQRLVRIREHPGQRVTTSQHARRADSLRRYLAKHGPQLDARGVARLEASLARARWHGAATLRERLDAGSAAVRAGMVLGPAAVLRVAARRLPGLGRAARLLERPASGGSA